MKTEQIRICHITSAHNSNDVRIFYKECTSLAKAGYDTYLVARGESREENNVHVIGIGQPSGGRLSRMMGFARQVYKVALKLDADIYHLHDPELLPYGVKLKKKGKKVIFDSHEDTLNQIEDKAWIPQAFRPFIARVYRRYAIGAFKKMDALISVTPHIVYELKLINPSTYQITNYPITDETYQKNAVVENDSIKLCFTGGISRQWNHGAIVAAISSIQNVEYVLCGLSSKAYMEQLSNMCGWEKVDYRGAVSHMEAVRIQYTSNVGMGLLQPSANTAGELGTIGNTKLFEYMMSGLPVICTNFVLWKEIIEKYHCGLCIVPDDVEAIAAAIIYLQNHPQEAYEMGQNGKRAIEQEFNWETQEEKLVKLYKSMENEVACEESRPC